MINKTTTTVNPKLSIIVPIFNVEASLSRCVDSILDQNYSNLELILVNDGSEDGSLSLCQEYCELDRRISVITQHNKGVSAARNVGIGAATGEYIAFVDPDDYLNKNAIQIMMNAALNSGADVSRTNYCVVDGKSSRVSKDTPQEGLYVGEEIEGLLDIVASGGLRSYVWLLIIKKSFIDLADIKFPEGITMMEDLWFYTDLLSKARKVFISDEITYNYVVNNQGASRTLKGLESKIMSVIAVNTHITDLGIVGLNMRRMNLSHLSIITSLIMVRIDVLKSRSNIKDLVATVSSLRGIKKLYESARLSDLDLYNRLAIWAIVNKNTFVIQGLRGLRRLMRKNR